MGLSEEFTDFTGNRATWTWLCPGAEISPGNEGNGT